MTRAASYAARHAFRFACRLDARETQANERDAADPMRDRRPALRWPAMQRQHEVMNALAPTYASIVRAAHRFTDDRGNRIEIVIDPRSRNLQAMVNNEARLRGKRIAVRAAVERIALADLERANAAALARIHSPAAPAPDRTPVPGAVSLNPVGQDACASHLTTASASPTHNTGGAVFSSHLENAA